MKKNFPVIIVVIAILFLLAGHSLAFAEGMEKDNPINRVFDKDFKDTSMTMEFNYLAEKYHDAWSAELKNVAAKIKGIYKFKEDRQRVDEYVALYEKLCTKAFDLEMLRWSDLSQPPGKRGFGTGAPGGAVLSEARILKQATLNLIDHYEGISMGKKYVFLYKNRGSQLRKLRKQIVK